jgi:hypothetical protein
MTQDYNEAVVISERRILSVKSKILIGILLAGIGAGLAWYGWLSYSSGKTYPVENFGINAELPADITASGYIYMSGFAENVGINTFALNLATKKFEPVTTSGNNWDYTSLDDSHALFSTALNETTEENIQIVIADFSENTYLNVQTPEGYYKRNIDAFVMEKDALVYSARTSPVTEGEDFFDPTKWTVVYGEPETNQFIVINEAFSPVVLQERNEIMYVKSDGVYVHNYFTKETYMVDTKLGNFFAGVEIALSADRTYVVMTLPLDNSIVVFEVTITDRLQLSQVGVINETDRSYITPLVSPDSQFYAVFAYTEDSKTETDAIEIRPLNSRGIIAQVPVKVVDDETVRLHEWGTGMILNTAKSHEYHDDGDHSHNN